MTITKKAFRYLLLLISIGIWLLVVAINSDSTYRIEETVIIGFYFATLIVYTLVLKQDQLEIFYPIHFVTLLYLCIFVFCPIYLIEAGSTTCNGSYIMNGAIKATFVFFVSYIALVMGYVSIKTPEFDSFSPVLDHELSKGYKQRIERRQTEKHTEKNQRGGKPCPFVGSFAESPYVVKPDDLHKQKA